MHLAQHASHQSRTFVHDNGPSHFHATIFAPSSGEQMHPTSVQTCGQDDPCLALVSQWPKIQRRASSEVWECAVARAPGRTIRRRVSATRWCRLPKPASLRRRQAACSPSPSLAMHPSVCAQQAPLTRAPPDHIRVDKANKLSLC